MTQRDLERHRLLERRDVLVRHFHDVLEAADHELDACELEDGMFKAAMWESYVLSQLGGELHELHDVIEDLDRLVQRLRDHRRGADTATSSQRPARLSPAGAP
jgi:hypothetical protein